MVRTAKDKLLFTPGPLTTSRSVKQAMLRDLGSRDSEFVEIVRDVCRRLCALGGDADGKYTAVPMQGSGTFAVESVVGSVIPPDGKLLVLANGAYGRRIAQIAATLKINHQVLATAEDTPCDPAQVEVVLGADDSITHVAVVHCETTSGLLNPVESIGGIVRRLGRVYIVDAMSSFGAVPLNLGMCGIDFLVASANKCVEGVPGFGFILAERSALLRTRGSARSVSLDLLAQYEELKRSGQFRFTPPTHAILAFQQALLELEEEGGVEGRATRYAACHQALVGAMRTLGFEEYLRPEHQSHIITSFRYPAHTCFYFGEFYDRLNRRGYVIYPGKVGSADCFRIGTIGRIFPEDVEALVLAIRATLAEMGVEMG